MRGCLSVFAVTLALVAGGAGNALSASITYLAADLPDAVPGEDLWQYSYSLGGVGLLSGQGFDVFFAVDDGFQFGDLVDPQTGPSPDWDVLAIQADPALSADGLFDVVALADDPSPRGAFLSTFIWRGTGTPGSQHFELFDEQLQVIESGETVPAPEPEAAGLLLAALAVLGLSRR